MKVSAQNDIDFDELDKAVSNLMGRSAPQKDKDEAEPKQKNTGVSVQHLSQPGTHLQQTRRGLHGVLVMKRSSRARKHQLYQRSMMFRLHRRYRVLRARRYYAQAAIII